MKRVITQVSIFPDEVWFHRGNNNHKVYKSNLVKNSKIYQFFGRPSITLDWYDKYICISEKDRVSFLNR